MKRKTIVIVTVLVVIALFFGKKLSNFLIGQKILGDYISINSEYLKIKPVKRKILQTNTGANLSSSLAQIKFNIPKTDTNNTFKLREVYRSFYFKDKSKLKIFRDSIKIDYVKILSSMNSSNENIIGDYLKENNISSNFDLLLFSYNKTPADISFFNLSERNTIIQYTFLKLKELVAGSGEENAFYYFILKNIKGFQFGSPRTERLISVRISVGDVDYLLNFEGFRQDQIDDVIASIDSNF